ncbi:MAG: hypothetical protein OXG55_04085 [bacterium]|nr:hypothetical protein [bacterium]MCY4102434.1 hypothetical protein [bacterium]
MRADSGFFSYDLLDRLDAHEVRWSVTIPQYAHVKAAIAAAAEEDWAPIECPSPYSCESPWPRGIVGAMPPRFAASS